MLFILKILSAVSLLPFVFVFLVSVMILLRLPTARLERYGGLPWGQIALLGRNHYIQSASNLISRLRGRTWGLLSAIGVIIMGFAIPYFSPESIKDPKMFSYLNFGMGFGGGWLMANGCVHYGNLVSWNLLGTKPPPGVG